MLPQAVQRRVGERRRDDEGQRLCFDAAAQTSTASGWSLIQGQWQGSTKTQLSRKHRPPTLAVCFPRLFSRTGTALGAGASNSDTRNLVPGKEAGFGSSLRGRVQGRSHAGRGRAYRVRLACAVTRGRADLVGNLRHYSDTVAVDWPGGDGRTRVRRARRGGADLDGCYGSLLVGCVLGGLPARRQSGA